MPVEACSISDQFIAVNDWTTASAVMSHRSIFLLDSRKAAMYTTVGQATAWSWVLLTELRCVMN